MSNDTINLPKLGARLAVVRGRYSNDIDLPNLGMSLFAMLLKVSGGAYESYELGEAEPTLGFLVALRHRTGVSLDWLLDPD